MNMLSGRMAIGSLLLFCGVSALAQVANGFDLSGALVPEREILAGGPPRDGIRALTDPARTDVRAADSWLDDDYPVRILNWHEVVNDVVAGRPVVVTYCPLCATGVVFDARLDGQRALFGVSGLLYKSDVLLFDRASESLFSQLLRKAITGRRRGTELVTLPASMTTWRAWKRRHPESEVLDPSLPYSLDYGQDPYEWYHRSGKPMFHVRGVNKRRPAKAWAWVVLDSDEELLVAEETLRELDDEQPHAYELDGVRLVYDPRARELRASGPGGERVVISGYWFALSAFHPGARHIEAPDLRR